MYILKFILTFRLASIARRNVKINLRIYISQQFTGRTQNKESSFYFYRKKLTKLINSKQAFSPNYSSSAYVQARALTFSAAASNDFKLFATFFSSSSSSVALLKKEEVLLLIQREQVIISSFKHL